MEARVAVPSLDGYLADDRSFVPAVTRMLAAKAASPVYHDLQQKLARETVTEFVEKWLIKQESWKAAEEPRIDVMFGE